MVLVYILCIAFLVVLFIINKESNATQAKTITDNLHKQEDLKTQYDLVKEDLNVPSDALVVDLVEKFTINKKNITIQKPFFVWITQNNLNIFPCERDLWHKDDFEKYVKEQIIPFESINYYTIEGSEHYETNIQGGSGGGSSITKGIIGGAIAGPVGAIVASRNKIQPIKSTTELKDNRILLLYFNNHDSLYFDHKLFYYLLKYLPEKDLSYITQKHL